jgi:DNA topoisomerase I
MVARKTVTTSSDTPAADAPKAKRATKSAGTPTKSDGRDLVVVESPAKAKTINKYLGNKYVVRASMGHVRDLPEHGLAVDIEKGFAPTYAVVAGRRKVVAELRKLAEKSNTVFLATDLDREGEAIAWHLAQTLELDPTKVRRVVFNEITRTAIQDAFSHPRDIDMGKVNAQQARRILDRIVGYELSPLLWKKIAKGLSAGRVQSVTVRMVVEREKEIRAFIPTEYWTITGFFAPSPAEAERLVKEWQSYRAEPGDAGDGHTQKAIATWLSAHQCLEASLVSVEGASFRPEGTREGTDAPVFKSAAGQARRVAEALGFVVEREQVESWKEYERLGLQTVKLVGRLDPARAPEFRIGDIQTKRVKTRPSAPFTTATLQQTAGSHLKLSPSRTMQLAQQLYEGVELAGEDGPVALITYMRTDSTNLSAESVQAARSWVTENCGDKYVPEKPNVYGSGKRAQEAHEAVRPTDAKRTPESLKDQLSGGLFKLYDLIWRRFMACQMTPAEWDSTVVSIEAATPAGRAEFKASGRTLAFDGFYKVLGVPRGGDEQILPPTTVGQRLGPLEIAPEQHFTSPPARYSEPTLVKRLEAEGIGRPSTYAAIIQTIQDRGYVEHNDRKLYATDKGMIVTDKLIEHFPDVMEYKFTSFMEDELDKIEDSDNDNDWVKVLHEFYDPFHTDLVRAHSEMEAARSEPSEYKCETCGAPMVYRWGKTGRFLSCTNYPECKGALNIDSQGRPIRMQATDVKCEVCGKDMIVRQSRHGSFLGCSGYPECSHTLPCDESGRPLKLVTEKELEEPCPNCGEGKLTVKRRGVRAFLGCDRYPKCKFTKPLPEGVRVERKVQPVEESGVACERCHRPMVIRTGRRGKFIACTGFPRCRNTAPIEKLEELRAKSPAIEAVVAEGGANGNGAKVLPAPARKGKGAVVNVAELGPPPAGFAWTRTGKPVVETWPEGDLHCPYCGSEMELKNGRFGPFFSCTGYPKCKTSINLRGEAKKRAEADNPPPEKPKPVPTDIKCAECGAPMMIRTGRSGRFLGCSAYPKCKATSPLPVELMSK